MQPSPRIVYAMPNWSNHPTGLPRYRCLRCGRLGSCPPSVRSKTGLRPRFCSSVCYRAALDLVLVMRFWSKVRLSPDCWEWTGARDRDGYGVHSGMGWWVAAHRRAWEINRGPIGPGLHVCHSCDNRACVRPSHLWLGDNTANSHDRDAKGRWAGGDRRGRHVLLLTVGERVALGRGYLAHALPPRLAAADAGVNVRTLTRALREAVIANVSH